MSRESSSGLKGLGVPIETIRTSHPYQVSVRFHEGANIEGNWFVIADALRQAGLDLSRVVKSKHSVDILSTQANKSHLVAHVIQEFKIDPYQILTMGDQGAWPGNDSSLLEHRYSLSVDAPSRRLDRGWKLAPTHKRDVDATLWYLDRIRTLGRWPVQMNLTDPPEQAVPMRDQNAQTLLAKVMNWEKEEDVMQPRSVSSIAC